MCVGGRGASFSDGARIASDASMGIIRIFAAGVHSQPWLGMEMRKRNADMDL